MNTGRMQKSASVVFVILFICITYNTITASDSRMPGIQIVLCNFLFLYKKIAAIARMSIAPVISRIKKLLLALSELSTSTPFSRIFPVTKGNIKLSNADIPDNNSQRVCCRWIITNRYCLVQDTKEIHPLMSLLLSLQR